jgi:hypothetical protein
VLFQNRGGRGITKLNAILLFTIIILTTVSSADAEPQGTVIKEGVLTYPAGPYLREAPILLSLGNYTENNSAPAELYNKPCNEYEHPFFGSDYCNTTQVNLSTCNLRVYLFNPHYMYYKPNTELLYSDFVFLSYFP